MPLIARTLPVSTTTQLPDGVTQAPLPFDGRDRRFQHRLVGLEGSPLAAVVRSFQRQWDGTTGAAALWCRPLSCVSGFACVYVAPQPDCLPGNDKMNNHAWHTLFPNWESFTYSH
jgi:hypothetical protein